MKIFKTHCYKLRNLVLLLNTNTIQPTYVEIVDIDIPYIATSIQSQFLPQYVISKENHLYWCKSDGNALQITITIVSVKKNFRTNDVCLQDMCELIKLHAFTPKESFAPVLQKSTENTLIVRPMKWTVLWANQSGNIWLPPLAVSMRWALCVSTLFSLLFISESDILTSHIYRNCIICAGDINIGRLHYIFVALPVAFWQKVFQLVFFLDSVRLYVQAFEIPDYSCRFHPQPSLPSVLFE